MAAILGASLNVEALRPSFPHPSNPAAEVAVFLDACHMLKLMRNALADKHVLLDGQGRPIKWEYIQRLQELQSREGLRVGNKLHERHIQWTKQKMKVKLAAQTLSSSVADALQFCQQELQLAEFQDCTATVEFIRVIDRLFDLLNSRNPLAKGFKAPMRPSNEHIWRPFILSAIHYIKGLKLQDEQPLHLSLRKTGSIGFMLSASSAVLLYDILVKQKSLLKYLLTYKFSQDHLELFFAAVRSRGGSNNNPSAQQLKATWKRLLTHNQLKDIATGNCEPLDNCKLLSIARSVDRLHSSPDVTIDTVSYLRRNDLEISQSQMDVADHDYVPNFQSLSRFVDNVVVYIAGFVARRLNAKIVCDQCKNALTKNDSNDDCFQSDFALIHLKNRGGLVSPSSDVIAVCKSAERCIRNHIGTNQRLLISNAVSITIVNEVLTHLIGTQVFESLREHALDTELNNNHQVIIMKMVASEYIYLRLYHQCKVITRITQGASCRSVLSKTVLFKGQ
jgi:hypothetical protein